MKDKDKNLENGNKKTTQEEEEEEEEEEAGSMTEDEWAMG